MFRLNLLIGVLCTSTVVPIISQDLPFRCPHKAPADVPQPCEDGGGFPTSFDLSDVSRDQYSEFQAALVIAPCKNKPISVFTTSNYNGSYSVAVICSDDSYVKRLEKWLKEKYDATTTNNPIRDLVANSNLQLVSGVHNDPSGEEILDAICPGFRLEPTMTFDPTDSVVSAGDSPTANRRTLRTKRQSYYHTSSLNRSPFRSAYIPKGYFHPHSAYRYHQYTSTINRYAQPKFKLNHHPSVENQYNSHREYQKYRKNINFGATPEQDKNVKFDDAPEPRYGLRVRTRRDFSCADQPDKCEELTQQGQIVYCNSDRLSGCSTQWVDCVEEDEQYLEENNFYNQSLATIGELGMDDRCLPGPENVDSEPYPGYLAETSRIVFEQNAIDKRNQERNSGRRIKRQTGERFASSATTCRVITTRLGTQRRRCDRLIEVRNVQYTQARQYTPPENFINDSDEAMFPF